MIDIGVLRAMPLVAIVACTSGERAAEPQPQQAVSVEPPRVTEAAIVPASEAGAETGSATPVVVAKPAPRTLELFPVVRGRSPLRLFETTDGELFVTANAQPIHVTASGPLAREPRFLAGIEDPGALAMIDWRAGMLGGRWTNALHLVVEAEGDRWSARPAVYRFTGNAWSRIPNVEGTLAWSYTAITPWTDDTMLTLRNYRAAEPEEEGEEWTEAKRLALERALAKAAPREFETLGGSAPNVPSFGERKVLAFASLASGDAVTIGDKSMLVWAGDRRKPSKVMLAREPVDELKLVMRSADDVWMYDDAGLLHFDGSEWTTVETPKETGVASFAIGADGKQWLVHGSSHRFSADENMLFEREAGGEWHALALAPLPFPDDGEPHIGYWADEYELLPAAAGAAEVEHPLVPMQVIARDGGLWLVARGPEVGDVGEFRWALLHTKDRGGVLEVPDSETMRRELLDLRRDVPFTGRKDCTVFVPIAVDDVASDQQSLRAELAKIELKEGSMLLLEVLHDGKPEIGVLIRGSYRKTIAKTIVTALKQPLGTRMGKPICQEMIIRRRIDEWSAD